MVRKLSAEFFGTFWLVFGGCGSAVLAAAFPELGIGFVGVSLAFGLTVLTMAYAVGGISGGHFNPAVSLGLAIGGRFAWKELVPYWIAQIAGAIVAAAALYAIASGKAGFAAGGFASNGFGELSPGGYSMQAALLIEIVLTAGFLIVILGSTSNAVPAGFAPIAIGLALTLNSSHFDPGHEHIGKSRPFDRCGAVRRNRSDGAALAVLVGAGRRRGYRCACLAFAAQT